MARGSAQGWNRTALHVCDCGADLGRAPAASASDFSGAYVHGRLTGLPDRRVPFLDGLSLAAAMPMVDRLGQVTEVGAEARWAPVDGAATDGARDRAFEIASGWPGTLEDALDATLAASRQAGPPPWHARCLRLDP